MASSLLRTSLRAGARSRAWLGLLVCCFAAGPEYLAAQAPGNDQLPRFTLHQIVIERNESLATIPSRLLHAAKAAYPDSLAIRSYTAAAVRSGLTPLVGGALVANRSQHVMGLYGRTELVQACRRTLESIREAIPSDSTRARFDRIFQPRGKWVVDLHDAALDWARGRDASLQLASAWRALAGSHWIDPSEGRSAEAIHRALYALAVLAGTDSVSFGQAKAALSRTDSSSTAAVLLLVQGYDESRRWYLDALSFFLREPWIPDRGGISIQDAIEEEWRRELPGYPGVTLPQIEARWFGYPQAVPHYGVPSQLFAHVIQTENAEARNWLEQNGQPRLLRALRWLPQGDSGLTLLRTRSETLRLTTASRQARESLNGFLEPVDAIAIDPGYSPLLALGALVHEWQHLLFRRQELEQLARELAQTRRTVVHLPQVEPHIAEGFAEWSAERILKSPSDRWPLLSVGELEKRAGLAQGGTEDQHVLGYALVRAISDVVVDPAVTTRLLLRHAESPAGLLAEPALRKTWNRYPGGGRAISSIRTAHRLLIPEVTFTVEDGFPDVVTTRILVPEADAPTR